MDHEKNSGLIVTVVGEADQLSAQSMHTRKQLRKLEAAADTLVEKAVAETILFNSQFASPTKIDRLFRQRISELTSRIHLLTFDIMDGEKTGEECRRLESELQEAEVSLEHFQLALELDYKLQGDLS